MLKFVWIVRRITQQSSFSFVFIFVKQFEACAGSCWAKCRCFERQVCDSICVCALNMHKISDISNFRKKIIRHPTTLRTGHNEPTAFILSPTAKENTSELWKVEKFSSQQQIIFESKYHFALNNNIFAFLPDKLDNFVVFLKFCGAIIFLNHVFCFKSCISTLNRAFCDRESFFFLKNRINFKLFHFGTHFLS